MRMLLALAVALLGSGWWSDIAAQPAARPTLTPEARHGAPARPEGARQPADLQRCWRDLVTVTYASPTMHGEEAIRRLLSTTTGAWLADQLCAMFVERATGTPRVRLVLHFTDVLPEHRMDSDGCFLPPYPGAQEYTVYVRRYPEQREEDEGLVAYGEYPGNAECDIVFLYQQPASSMAQTLFHELLHIWFIHHYRGIAKPYPTGHGVARRCEFDEEFLELLARHSHELDLLEGRRRLLAP